MKISYSSIERFTNELGQEQVNGNTTLDTKRFGLIETRFLIGLIVHKSLELYFIPFINEIISKFKIEQEELNLIGKRILKECYSINDPEFNNAFSKIKRQLRNAKRLLLNNAREFKILSVETSYQIDFLNHEIIAKPDLVLLSPNNLVYIIDWKTQSIASKRTDHEQLKIYKFVLEKWYNTKEIYTFSAYLDLNNWIEIWHSGVQEDYLTELIHQNFS